MQSNLQITMLLHAWQSGDGSAYDQLIAAVYSQLHTLAEQYMRRERNDHTLRPTALVHEAYLRLLGTEASFEDRSHFLAVAASTMRRILVDHARASHRIKRGNGAQKLALEEAGLAAATSATQPEADILDLDRALDRLTQQDPRKAKLLELVYFGGLNCEEAAGVLTVSVATVNRDLKFARAWLRHELTQAAASGASSS
ncbi:MAG: hypothetical protein QOK38_1735 [Acidobacteriaceae bacterium]|nr:hypothetical protein [Acidobacteriaceae bacterium]